jgi:uncharacterized protein involved in outer membrane biogenesis
MRKLFKLLLSLAMVLVIVAVALPFLIPIESYKQEIAEQVKKATGRELIIAGDMHAGLLPTLNISIENVSLSNPAGYSAKHMLQVGKLVGEIEFWPLLHKQVQVKRFVLEKPVINLEVDSSGKPNWEFPTASKTPAAGTGKANSTLPDGLVIRNVGISGGEIHYLDRQKNRSITLTDVRLSAAADAKSVDISEMRGKFYDGTVTASAALNADGTFTKHAKVENVQAEPFLKNALGEERFSGVLNMKIDIGGKLLQFQPAMDSLKGSGSIKINDGAMKGVDIAGMVRNVQSAFKQVDTSQKKTDFSELGGTFTIAKGIFSNNDLAMKAPLLRLSGQGTIDLPQQTIRYRLTPELVQTTQGQGGKEKQGLAVPVIIDGPVDNPRYTPDLTGVAQELLQNPEAAKDAVKSVKEQIKENKGAIKDLLKGIGR